MTILKSAGGLTAAALCALSLPGALGLHGAPAARLERAPGRIQVTIQAAEPAKWEAIFAPFGLRVATTPSRFRLLAGDTPESRKLGFAATQKKVRVAQVVDLRDPDVRMVWQKPTELPVHQLPAGARVFVREKTTGAPLLAGLRTPEGAVLWAAADPGPRGYERFPYLMHAFADLGLVLPFREDRRWFFFDYAYRTRVDLEYMARRWRRAGIAALHVSGWHFQEPDPGRDRYLETLIEACHRQGILVYAWLELPHVSGNFWDTRPRCREKTATLQDARLDWRKLVNLADPGCFAQAQAGVTGLLRRFDWDGVNLAELYFESLHGPGNAARFTPMNDWVREDYRRQTGIDPVLLFDPDSPSFWRRNQARWLHFSGYRADLALELQRRWLRVIRETTPELDIVITQIDDRFDTRMREYLGADTAALLALVPRYDFRLAVEDPATLWNLGPQRYAEIARRYRDGSSEGPGEASRLIINLNIVERYQQTYPTKKQTGTELFQLLHEAGKAFSQVILYAEQSISRADQALIGHAGPSASARWEGQTLRVETQHAAGVTWSGAARVNGRLWPVGDGKVVWLPPGRHLLSAAVDAPPLRLLRWTGGDLSMAESVPHGVRFAYRARSRAIALVERRPAEIHIDGEAASPRLIEAPTHWAVLLPRGEHTVLIREGGLLR